MYAISPEVRLLKMIFKACFWNDSVRLFCCGQDWVNWVAGYILRWYCPSKRWLLNPGPTQATWLLLIAHTSTTQHLTMLVVVTYHTVNLLYQFTMITRWRTTLLSCTSTWLWVTGQLYKEQQWQTTYHYTGVHSQPVFSDRYKVCNIQQCLKQMMMMIIIIIITKFV